MKNKSLHGKTVICDARSHCLEAPNCGGSKPHHFDEVECSKCPIDKEAECKEVNKEDEDG